MKKPLTQVLTLVALVAFSGPAIAQQQSWSVAIEQNPMLTNCGTTTDIPVAGANNCATAITAAQNLLTTLLATPNCMAPSCPADYTMTPGVPSCTEDHYTHPNGSPAIRYQVNLQWNCVPARVICANPPPATNYNTGSTSANNVPLNQCYKNDVGECLYNFAAPGTIGGWNTGCPPAIAGSNCCGWTPSPATRCQDDLNNGTLTIIGPTASNITANSANLSGSVNVAPVPPGCTYQAELVWEQAPVSPPFANTLATGTIPTSPLSLNGTASPLNPSSVYGARIEVTKSCVGLAPSECNGQTISFETPKGKEKCDLVIGKSPSKGSIPLVSGHQATFEIVVTNQGTGTCLAPISVTDNFTLGLTYLSGGTSGWVCPQGSITGANSLTCTNSTPLAPSQSSLLLVTFDVTAPPRHVVGDCAIGKNANDTNPANNRACIEFPVGKPKLPDQAIQQTNVCHTLECCKENPKAMTGNGEPCAGVLREGAPIPESVPNEGNPPRELGALTTMPTGKMCSQTEKKLSDQIRTAERCVENASKERHDKNAANCWSAFQKITLSELEHRGGKTPEVCGSAGMVCNPEGGGEQRALWFVDTPGEIAL